MPPSKKSFCLCAFVHIMLWYNAILALSESYQTRTESGRGYSSALGLGSPRPQPFKYTSTWGSHTSTNPKQDKTDGYLLPRTCGQQAMTRRAAQTWTRMTAADSWSKSSRCRLEPTSTPSLPDEAKTDDSPYWFRSADDVIMRHYVSLYTLLTCSLIIHFWVANTLRILIGLSC